MKALEMIGGGIALVLMFAVGLVSLALQLALPILALVVLYHWFF